MFVQSQPAALVLHRIKTTVLTTCKSHLEGSLALSRSVFRFHRLSSPPSATINYNQNISVTFHVLGVTFFQMASVTMASWARQTDGAPAACEQSFVARTENGDSSSSSLRFRFRPAVYPSPPVEGAHLDSSSSHPVLSG